MARKSPVKITQDIFKKVHTLKDSGVFTNVQIADIVGISDATVSYISRTKTLEEYKAIIATASQIKRAKTMQDNATKELFKKNLDAESAGNNFQEAQLDRIIELLVEQNRTLKQIATVWDVKEPVTEYDLTKDKLMRAPY